MVYLDQQPDGSWGFVGDVIPEGKLTDGTGLFPNRTSYMSFIAFESHRCGFQIDEMALRDK